jgi:hypothetical protein
MTAKEVMEQLLQGKKVGFDDTVYWFLNAEGALVAGNDYFDSDEDLGMLLSTTLGRIIPEEGP